jgi:hypothetical protein
MNHRYQLYLSSLLIQSRTSYPFRHMIDDMLGFSCVLQSWEQLEGASKLLSSCESLSGLGGDCTDKGSWAQAHDLARTQGLKHAQIYTPVYFGVRSSR